MFYKWYQKYEMMVIISIVMIVVSGLAILPIYLFSSKSEIVCQEQILLVSKYYYGAQINLNCQGGSKLEISDNNNILTLACKCPEEEE